MRSQDRAPAGLSRPLLLGGIRRRPSLGHRRVRPEQDGHVEGRGHEDRMDESARPHLRRCRTAEQNDSQLEPGAGSGQCAGAERWTRSALKVGDTVTVEGIQARSGASIANARSVVLPDGRKVFSGAADQ